MPTTEPETDPEPWAILDEDGSIIGRTATEEDAEGSLALVPWATVAHRPRQKVTVWIELDSPDFID